MALRSGSDTITVVGSKVAIVVEQLWHKVPGGTGVSTRQTIAAMLGMADSALSDSASSNSASSNSASGFEMVGIAARHTDRSPAESLGIQVEYQALPRPALYESWLRIGRPALSVKDADVVWAAAMVLPPARVPIVTTVHDLDFLDWPQHLSGRGRRFFPLAWSETLERSSAMAVPSEVVKRACVRHGADSGKVFVIPWGVTNNSPSAAYIEKVRALYGLPETFVLWVGTLEPRKNLFRLVQALSGLDVPLVIVGPDGWGLDGEELLAPLGSSVTRLSNLSRSDLDAVYAAASVFAFPSLAEGFGLPVLEAMSQNTPVVTSRGTATEEVAGTAALLVDPESSEELGAAIAGLLGDETRAARLAALGLERAREFTWDRTALSYRILFDQVARQ